MSRKTRLAWGGAWLLAAVGVSYGIWRGLRQPGPVARPAGEEQPNANQPADKLVEIGGVKRPAGDLWPAPQATDDKSAEPTKDIFDYGQTKPVPADLNPQVRSVAEALREKKHPERVSVMIAPAAFNSDGFKADPQAYLDTIEPGRVFQVAQPGKDVPRLAAASEGFQQVTQGAAPAVLRVRATPGAPVTFTSFDLGEFSNRLTSITVQADKQGVAEAKFFGTPGTIEDINILAGSPVASGQVKFVVNVQLAKN